MQKARRQAQPTAPTLVAQPAHAARSRSAFEPPRVAGYAGNQTMLRRLSRTTPHLQCKLQIGAVNDPLEAEADRVADQVTHMPGAGSTSAEAPQTLRRKCAACEEEHTKSIRTKRDPQPQPHAGNRRIGPVGDPAEREADTIANAIIAGNAHGTPSRITAAPIQAKGVNDGPCSSGGGERDDDKPGATAVQTKSEAGSTGANAVLSSRLDARHGGGEPLPAAIRSNFERHLGMPLGGVHVHRDAEAGEMARSISALAFTTGQDVYFAPGRYAPETPEGAHLIAHELVHVVQQGGRGGDAPIRRFTLKGFDPTQEAQMRAAVASAKTKVGACGNKGISQHDLDNILRGLEQANYVYTKDLGDCGYSNPFTDTIQVGPDSFKPDICCDLDSTLAHECAHSFAWGFEKFARNVECQCFGCSCNYGKTAGGAGAAPGPGGAGPSDGGAPPGGAPGGSSALPSGGSVASAGGNAASS